MKLLPQILTQNPFILLLHTFLFPPFVQVQVLVTIDLCKIFDYVGHEHLFVLVRKTSYGHSHTYIFRFFKNRKASVCKPDETSQSITLPRGAPARGGAFPYPISPQRAQLAGRLLQIPQRSHLFYADDLTLWCTHASPAAGTGHHK